MRLIVTFLLSFSLITACPALAQNWSPQPWLDDLTQVHQAFATKYANIGWLEQDREIPLASLFDKAASRLRSARSDAEARAVFDRLIERVGDGHVSIEWPQAASLPPASVAAPAKQFDACEDLGFDQGRSTPGTAVALPGLLRGDEGEVLSRMWLEMLGGIFSGGVKVVGQAARSTG